MGRVRALIDMPCSRQNLWTTLGLALGITLLGCCGPSHNNKLDDTTKAAEVTATPAAAPAVPPQNAESGASGVTVASDDEFIANGREIVRRLVVIFKTDGQDCKELAADVSRLSEDPIWAASTRYEDAHPEVRARFQNEQAEMGKRFAAAAMPAINACAKNEAFAGALAKMR
jgi:hypothetical protein